MYLYISWPNLHYLNGFDTTNFSVNGDSSVSNGYSSSSINEESLKNLKNTISLDTPFVVNAMNYDNKSNDYYIGASFNLIFSSELNSLCIFLSEDMKYTDLSREIMLNFFYFAVKTEASRMCFLLTRKNRDYIKFLQGIMTVGFKPNTKNSKFTYEGKDFKVMTMEIPAKFDEVQEIDF